MSSFAALGLAQESKFAREATTAALRKRVRDLVAKGVITAAEIEAFARASTAAATSASASASQSSIFSAAAAAASSDVPTRVVTKRPAAEAAFRHVPGTLPTARGGAAAADAWLLGTRVSLGRAKWVSPTKTSTTVSATSSNAVATSTSSSSSRSASTSSYRSASISRPASIFSVADGRRLANEPVRHLTAFEAARAARVAKHAAETPLVAGLRLMPIYTPGRALLWGTVLAAWGTAAAVASSARALGVQNVSEAPEALRAYFAPAAERMRFAAEPWKGSLAISGGAAAAAVNDEGSSVSMLSRKLKSKLSEVQ